jgi:hypothetical protein
VADGRLPVEAIRVPERRAGDRLPPGEMLAGAGQPTLGVVRSAGRDQAAGAGHDERDEQGSLARRAGDGPALLTASDRRVRGSGQEVCLGEAP